MGAYLSEPVTEKLSSDEDGKWLSYGASSMQGWRVSQEDAHNSILDFDTDTHLFAVYDGHGGHEVAAYTALKLPDFFKDTEAYKSGNISQALTDAFLEFDATLVKADVVTVLKQIAGTKDEDEDEEDNSESESEEVDNLYREATMPLDEVMAKYAENPQLSRCKKEKLKEKGVSPFLKAKSNSVVADGEEPIKFALDDEEPDSSVSQVNEDSSTENTKGNSEGNQNGTKDETAIEVNGEETEHMINGEGGEDNVEETKINGKSDTEEKLEECTIENGNIIVNGDDNQEAGKGKGKSSKGSKGKALLKNSEVLAMKVAKAKEKRREAAIKAAEIYRKIQEGGSEEDLSDEEEEDDDNFEDEGGEEAEEEAEGEESEEEEEEDVEAEDDDDPYTEFAMNMKEEGIMDTSRTRT
ncbi:hypothetical protein OTU49_006945 [Cherax quadricarinatus]|uniref:PPM-type phosphatase domain-containing protein n=1 Tax=Cherax quadricarinatus TaxID=27406 RepID=A0AAW0WZT8_CHEQU